MGIEWRRGPQQHKQSLLLRTVVKRLGLSERQIFLRLPLSLACALPHTLCSLTSIAQMQTQTWIRSQIEARLTLPIRIGTFSSCSPQIESSAIIYAPAHALDDRASHKFDKGASRVHLEDKLVIWPDSNRASLEGPHVRGPGLRHGPRITRNHRAFQTPHSHPRLGSSSGAVLTHSIFPHFRTHGSKNEACPFITEIRSKTLSPAATLTLHRVAS